MSDSLSAGDLLTEGQRRHLTVSLARVERAVREITALAGRGEAPPSLLLTRVIHDLPPDFGQSIQSTVGEAGATLAELASTFALEAPRSFHARSVQALVISSLVVIEDTASRNLRGYGEVHPGVPPLLDPLLNRLHETLVAIGRVLTTSHPREGTET
jgi:hypothetical protein